MRVEDKDIHRIEAPKSFNRGRSSVAGCRANDCHAFARTLQRKFEHLPDELHGEVFEREGWAVKQLHQKVVRLKLHNRGARGVAEARVCTRDATFEFIISESVTDKRTHDAKGNLFVACATHRTDIIGAEFRNGIRHIKTTIAREACEHRLFKGKDRSRAARRDVFHDVSFCAPRARHR